MLDSEKLRPVIIAMTLYIALVKGLPMLMKKPSGIKLVDDLNMLMISQQGFLMSGALLVGLIVYLTNYANAELF
jgi:hypothetical protein